MNAPHESRWPLPPDNRAAPHAPDLHADRLAALEDASRRQRQAIVVLAGALRPLYPRAVERALAFLAGKALGDA